MESANVVGYQHLPLTNGYSFLTITFKNVAQEKIDLCDFKPMRVKSGEIIDFDTGTGMNACKKNQIFVSQISAGGAYLDQYHYISTTNPDTGKPYGWMLNGETPVASVPLKNGEGLIMYNQKSNGTAVLQVSGEVDLVNQIDIPNGYSFSGNNTPVPFELAQMKPMRVKSGEVIDFDTGTGMNACKKNQIFLSKISPQGAYQTQYHYVSTTNPETGKPYGWMVNGDEPLTKTVVFQPGEGYILYSQKSAGTAVMRMPHPLN